MGFSYQSENDFLDQPRVTARSGVRYFSRRGLAILSTLMKLEGNMQNDALGNSVTSNLENLVLF